MWHIFAIVAYVPTAVASVSTVGVSAKAVGAASCNMDSSSMGAKATDTDAPGVSAMIVLLKIPHFSI